MREQRIYVDSPLNCEARLTLSLATSHYISKVLRMRSGQHLLLFNGHGGCYRAEILSISKREVEVYLQEFRDENRESILHITLAQAVSRTQHMDYTLQKAVELGVSKIVPVITEFGNVRIDSAGAEKKLGHWQKIIISACEQCGRNSLPDISAPVSLEQWLAMDSNAVKLLLHPGASGRLTKVQILNASLSILSGPEGGFSPTEVEQATASNYVSIELGPRVLRTETAAIAAISACQTLWGDMG